MAFALSPWQDLSRLFFPHHCLSCGADHLTSKAMLCVDCVSLLPQTGFFDQVDNPTEKTFWGRIPLQAGAALYYYSPGSLLQEILHRLKYHHQPQWGHFLGRAMGRALADAPRFAGVDLLVPVPLHPDKEKQRGYNQAFCLAEGIALTWQKTILANALVRPRSGKSQTKENRLTRWEQMQNSFSLGKTKGLEGKHVLLVDDVLTTGATLEACAKALLRVPGLQLSLATAGYSD
ncbi:MAG: ComF family protein [Sphingobacteriia bacterium]|nr:MAG: ComF family protein [Sphingobacteriia bacterium]